MQLVIRLKNYALMLLAVMPINMLASNAPLYDIEMVIFERSSQGNPAKLNQNQAGTNNNPVVWLYEGVKFRPIVHTLKQKGALVHVHARWRQAVQNRKTPQWLSIGSQRLSGKVQMGRGRYLHFNTDLYLQKSGVRHRIKLHRRMRSGETHYIDHPKVGIIVRAEPYAIASKQVKPTLPTQPEPVKPEAKPKSTLPRAMPDPS